MCERVSDHCDGYGAGGICTSCFCDRQLTVERTCEVPPAVEPNPNPVCAEADEQGFCLRCTNSDPYQYNVIFKNCEYVGYCEQRNEDGSCGQCPSDKVMKDGYCIDLGENCSVLYWSDSPFPGRCRFCPEGYHHDGYLHCVENWARSSDLPNTIFK